MPGLFQYDSWEGACIRWQRAFNLAPRLQYTSYKKSSLTGLKASTSMPGSKQVMPCTT